MYQHLLVPVDGTPLGSITVEQAAGFARGIGARITFLHVQADFAGTGEGSLLHAMDPAGFEQAAAGHSHAWLARAAAAAAAAGVACDTVAVTGDRPHEAIHDVALARGCDLVFMASHRRRDVAGRLAGSVTGRLLELTTLPVLVARVESNAVLTPEQRALTVIRDEHRSLAAVIRALQSAVAPQAPPADYPTLHAAVFYLGAFPERLHHPREEQTLFRLLRERAPESHALLDALEQQHREGARSFEQLRAGLAAFEAAGASGRAAFEQTLREYADLQWQHMGLEESQLLPLASRLLTPTDWQSVATAFETHQDPRFDRDTEAGFTRVFKRLMDLAARTRDGRAAAAHHDQGEETA